MTRAAWSVARGFWRYPNLAPRSLIYHEGRMFRVDRAKLNIHSSDSVSADSKLATIAARVCIHCGYGHLGDDTNPEPLSDVCEHCRQPLADEGRINSLYRIETVETTVQERISVNEEERQRQGFELQTTYRSCRVPAARRKYFILLSNTGTRLWQRSRILLLRASGESIKDGGAARTKSNSAS